MNPKLDLEVHAALGGSGEAPPYSADWNLAIAFAQRAMIPTKVVDLRTPQRLCEIALKHARKNNVPLVDGIAPSRAYVLNPVAHTVPIVIEFDGGTSCNVPSKGFGGDSQIALNWVAKSGLPKSTGSKNFVEAVAHLHAIADTFKKVTTEWRKRTVSVKIFGH